MRKKPTVYFTILLFSVISSAQSGVGAIWLLISPSASMNGMGSIGVCLPDTDPIAAYFNPANGMLAYRGISVASSNMYTDWLQNLAPDIELSHSYLGFNLLPAKFPFQLVFNNQNTIFDLGTSSVIDTSGNIVDKIKSSMTSNAISLSSRYYGDLWRIPLDISIGFTRKEVVQRLGEYKSENTYYDYGMLASLPFKFYPDEDWYFSISPALGYSLSNIGDSIVFIDEEQADPTPRTVRTGFSISTGMALADGWQLFEYRGARAAEDILFKSIKPIRYQSGLGDIDFFKNILLSEKDSALTISRGHEVSFLDIYTFRFGRLMDISGETDEYSTGYGIRSTGIFSLLAYLSGIEEFSLINNFFTIEYNYAKWTEEAGHPRDDTEFSAYTFSITNIDQFIRWMISDKPSAHELHFADLTLLSGLNFSKMLFSDNETSQPDDLRFGSGVDLGIEKKVKFLILGLSFTQYSARYKFDVPTDWSYLTPTITETYNYLTLYGLVPVALIGPLGAFGGVQIANCLSVELEAVDNSDCFSCPDGTINYGLLGGFDIAFGPRIVVRTSYNYWLKSRKSLIYNDGNFKLHGVRVNLLFNL